MREILSYLLSVVQIAFWMTVAIVTILTYRQARRTVLQPLRTEVFKRQLDDMAEVLKIFAGKGEFELRNDLHFPQLRRANIEVLYDEYAEFAFQLMRPEVERAYRRELCPISIFSASKMQKYIVSADDHVAEGLDSSLSDSNPVKAEWDFDLPGIALPRAHTEFMDQLDKVLSNPLLPSPMSRLVEEYQREVSKAISVIEQVIDDCAKEMSEKYSTIEDLKSPRFDWIENRINAKMLLFEPIAKRIVDFARTYFGPDLMAGKSAPWPIISNNSEK